MTGFKTFFADFFAMKMVIEIPGTDNCLGWPSAEDCRCRLAAGPVSVAPFCPKVFPRLCSPLPVQPHNPSPAPVMTSGSGRGGNRKSLHNQPQHNTAPDNKKSPVRLGLEHLKRSLQAHKKTAPKLPNYEQGPCIPKPGTDLFRGRAAGPLQGPRAH